MATSFGTETSTKSTSTIMTTLYSETTITPPRDISTVGQTLFTSTVKSTQTSVSTASTTLSNTLSVSSTTPSTSSAPSTTTSVSGVSTTSLSTTAPSSGIDMTILISAGAAAGTVLLAIIIVLICLCCRCCKNRAHRKRKEKQFSDLTQPKGERPDPLGQSMDRKNIERTNNKVNEKPVYKVEDSSEYLYKPYIVGSEPRYDAEFNNPRYNTTPGNRKDSFGPPPPSHPSTLSIPRPSVKPTRPVDNRQPTQLQPAIQESHHDDHSVYDRQIPVSGNWSLQQSNDNRLARNYSNTDGSKHTENYDSSLLRNKAEIAASDGPRERKYAQRSQQKKSNISPQREKSGKYEQTIVPYDGSTYNISGDFTKVVEPLGQNNADVPKSPSYMENPQSPTKINPPQVLPKPNKVKEEVKHQPHNNSQCKTDQKVKKQVRRVPQENDQKESQAQSELSNNPVFNKRKNLIDAKCKTIRLDDTKDMFVKANIDNPEEEDPYWKIRESKLTLMNIIPQGKDRVQSTASMDYDDVVPNTNNLHSSDEEYEDTAPNDYINIPHNSRSIPQDDDKIYENSNGIQKNDQSYEHAENEELSDTMMRRLPSMRASMPPEVLSNALDQLFDDALAGSELDLSIAPPPPTTPGNNQRAPVLKRKTKIEESKSEDQKQSDSWRISRSSFFDEIGADEPNAQLGQWGNEDYINASMVKKGMALRDVNKPFTYMGTK